MTDNLIEEGAKPSQEMNDNWWILFEWVGAFIIYWGLYIWLGLMFVYGMNWRDDEPGTKVELDLEEQGDTYDFVKMERRGDRSSTSAEAEIEKQ